MKNSNSIKLKRVSPIELAVYNIFEDEQTRIGSLVKYEKQVTFQMQPKELLNVCKGFGIVEDFLYHSKFKGKVKLVKIDFEGESFIIPIDYFIKSKTRVKFYFGLKKCLSLEEIRKIHNDPNKYKNDQINLFGDADEQ
jgi:hypothetical protein